MKKRKGFMKSLIGRALSVFLGCGLSLLGLVGCQQEIEMPDVPGLKTLGSVDADGNKTYRLGFKAAAASLVEVKASCDDNLWDGVGTLNNISCRIYCDGFLLYSWTGKSTSSVVDFTLNPNQEYTVIAWNDKCTSTSWAGRFTSSFNNSSLSNLLNSYYEFLDYFDDWEAMGDYGNVPFSFYKENINGNDLDALDGSLDNEINISLEPLLAKVNFSIEYDDMLLAMCPTETVSGTSYGITVQSVTLGGLHQRVGIFSSDKNLRCVSDEDITVNQIGYDPVWPRVMYVPESLGGELLPNCNHPFNKSAEAVEELGYNREEFPYIQVRVQYKTYHAIGTTTKTYRFYLGENATTNFDVKRGYQYNVTLRCGYDGLDYTGTWKIDGSPSIYLNPPYRCIDIDPFNGKVQCYPNEQIIFIVSDDRASGGAQRFHFSQTGNGYSVSTSADAIANWVETGTIPFTSGTPSLGLQSTGTWCLTCMTCKHSEPVPFFYQTATGYSGNMSMQSWSNSKFNKTLVTANVYSYKCKWCGTALFTSGPTPSSTAYDALAMYSNNSPTSSGYGGDKLKRYSIQQFTGDVTGETDKMDHYLTFTVPSTANAGDVITVYGSSRDGRITNKRDFNVKTSYSAVEVSKEWSGPLYVGQKKKIVVDQFPGSYLASNFTFNIVDREAPNGDPDNNVAVLSGASVVNGKPQVYVECQKSGNFSIQVLYNSSVVASIYSWVNYPQIGYPDTYSGRTIIASSNYIVESTNIVVPNGGEIVRYYRPVYIIPGIGTNVWQKYTDYDATLLNTWLGDVYPVETDSNGWLQHGLSTSPAAVRLQHAYKNGAENYSNRLPWREPDTAIGYVRYLPSVAVYVPGRVRVASSSGDATGDTMWSFVQQFNFEDLTGYLSYESSLLYHNYVSADAEDRMASNPSLTTSFLPQLSNHFSYYFNNVSCEANNILSRTSSVTNRWINKNYGCSEVRLKIKGASSDYFEYPLTTMTFKKHYIGSIASTINGVTNTSDYHTYNDYLDRDAHPETRGDHSTLNSYSYEEIFTLNYVPGGLVNISLSSPLPSSGMYDPDNIAEGTNEYSQFPIVYSASGIISTIISLPLATIPGAFITSAVFDKKLKSYHDKTFYYSAEHYRYNSLSYSIRLNRWFILEAYFILGNDAEGIECLGFGPVKYRSYNNPLFRPASSPQTISGITWTKIVDDGTTAVWSSSDGYQDCTFKYGAWE